MAQPSFSKDDTEATVKDKLKDHETAVNNAILADRADKAAAAGVSLMKAIDRIVAITATPDDIAGGSIVDKLLPMQAKSRGFRCREDNLHLIHNLLFPEHERRPFRRSGSAGIASSNCIAILIFSFAFRSPHSQRGLFVNRSTYNAGIQMITRR